MAKSKIKRASSPGLKVYNIGPLSRDYYIYHEVTSAGGIIFRLLRGSSNSPHAINLAPDFKYGVVRHDNGINSTLTVHKIRRSHRVIADCVVPEVDNDPTEETECCCGPGYDTCSDCPPDSLMTCDAVLMKTSCTPFAAESKKKN